MKKVRVPKSVINAMISAFVLLILFVGAGVGYIWYSGQSELEDAASTAMPVATSSAPVVTPTKPAANAPVGVSVQRLTTPVAPGENATIGVRTTPEAECTILVEYDKVPSKDSGLKPKAADIYGTASWTWTVEESAPLGTWPVIVECYYNEKSGVVKADLEVGTEE